MSKKKSKRKGAERTVVEGPGFRIKAVDGGVVFDSHRTPEQYRALQEQLAKTHADLPGKISQDVARLEALLARFNPLDVIAHMVLAHIVANPETFSESGHHGSQAHVEYVTLLCLKSPYGKGETRLINGPHVEEILRLVGGIFAQTMWYYGSEPAEPGRTTPPSALQDLRFRTILDALFVRNPGYEHHLEKVLRGLFGAEPAASWMTATPGFTIGEAILLARQVTSLVENRLAARRSQFRESVKQIRQEVEAYQRTGAASTTLPTDFLRPLAKLKPKKQAQETTRVAMAQFYHALGDALSFTAEELAARAELSIDKVQAYLDLFAIDFGTVPKDFERPQMTHPLQARPIVRHPTGYLCPAPGMLHWAIRPRLEAMLNPEAAKAKGTNPNTWERYQKRRGSYLVEESVRLIGGALKRAQVYRNLRYRISPEVETDLDGLVLFDTVAFLIEGKGGQLSAAARRGAPLRLIRDVEALVGDPHRQALRARDFIRATDHPEFTTETGEVLRFDKTRYRTLVLVTVTIEPLDPVVTMLHRSKDLGIFSPGELPWAVQLLDLKVIAELIEFPSQLVHYLSRRLRVNDVGRIGAHDELDWFGSYLHQGLYFDDMLASGEVDMVQLQGFTDAIDAYYWYQTGQRRTPAPKPAQPMPDVFRQLIRELEEMDGVGYSTVVAALLDPGWSSRQEIAKQLATVADRAEERGKTQTVTLFFGESDTGITLIGAPSMPPQKFAAGLPEITAIEKYKRRLRRIIAIGRLAGQPGVVHGWAVGDTPWAPDPKIEALLGRIGSPPDPSRA